ncbi:MAG: hypothetical protein HN704_04145 [Bacteroidetes bacterium]|nr:hypothetical protein [Bacteroidota bacterium]MBT6687219.1 hypothetical protein [Bacteroidota bacterium]MBT7144584.1 hypothetical protein [Bacteroidota bacterium]MBT7490784.1 hypothetical protein [Bacteroidota bacterium]
MKKLLFMYGIILTIISFVACNSLQTSTDTKKLKFIWGINKFECWIS